MNNAKLSQIIAVEKGIKNRVNRELTDCHQLAQKPPLLSGLSRTYKPDDENGEQFPPERTEVQVKAENLIHRVSENLIELFDITATKDASNCEAKADIIVNDKVFLKAVPVTTLLFLEKSLNDLYTFVKKLPTLDPSEVWVQDSASGNYMTEPTYTAKTKKKPQVLEKAKATDKHPAQTEVWHEDVKVGSWKLIKFSGCLPPTKVEEMLRKVETLQKAVKFAREEANTSKIVERKLGKEILSFIFE